MPLKLNVGLSKKVGQPDFGSLGASCNLQFEMDATLLQSDPEGFNQQVRNAYSACRSVVDDELSRQQAGTNGTTVPTSQPAPNNGNGTNGHRATDKQLDYARQLAGQIKGLGVRRLDAISQQMFAKPVADLSTVDASGLIDSLKQIKSGEIDLASVLNGATS